MPVVDREWAMPYKQSHRGKHPSDGKLFSEKRLPVLTGAVKDLSYLFSRGYSGSSALKLVGDRYQLTVRQRRAVLGAACSDESLAYRRTHRVPASGLKGQTLAVDGYNLLITTECALSAGVLLRGRDGCIRDLASIHGSYRRVEETLPAVRLIGKAFQRLRVGRVNWYFDAPVSNSGRLQILMYHEASEAHWDWQIELTNRTDQVLEASGDIVVTSDSWILDRAKRWANISQVLVRFVRPRPEVIDMRP